MSYPAAQSNYIPSLDGLRAVSVTLVFLAHAGISKLIPGGFGVTVFFFLSGYLITTLLIQEYERYQSIAIKEFYLRRLVRLAPPLLVTLACATLLVLFGLARGNLNPGAFFSQIFFYYNYHSLIAQQGPLATVEGLAILWSLAVEEHFYLIYPWIFVALFTAAGTIRKILVVLALVLIWRAIRLLILGDAPFTIYISTDTRIDSILYGCLLALMTTQGMSKKIFQDRLMYPYICAGLVVLAVSFLVRDEVFRSTLRYSLQGFALMPLFYYAIAFPKHWLFRPLNWKPVRRVGQYSYTLYLAHYVIIGALMYNDIFTDNRLAFAGLAATLSLIYSALIFEFCEKPFKPLRQRLTGH